MAEVTCSRTALGRYEVFHRGERVGRVRTALRSDRSHGRWCWLVVGENGSIAKSKQYRSREEATWALLAA